MSRRAYGFRAWLVQRLSALYLGLYSIYLLFHFIGSPPVDHAAWKAWLACPTVSVSMALFVLMVLMHAWIGVRDVVIDYIHPLGMRYLLLSLVMLLLLGCGYLIFRTLILVSL